MDTYILKLINLIESIEKGNNNIETTMLREGIIFEEISDNNFEIKIFGISIPIKKKEEIDGLWEGIDQLIALKKDAFC